MEQGKESSESRAVKAIHELKGFRSLLGDAISKGVARNIYEAWEMDYEDLIYGLSITL